LTKAGGVRCWGDNSHGQLGDGTTANRSLPPTSDVISGVRALHANYFRTCVVMETGGLRCWGDGVLNPPTQDIIAGASEVASGSEHLCVLLETGGVRCWGKNTDGQLGNGTKNAVLEPPATDLLTGVKAISAGGKNTCALLASGNLRCWGYGLYGPINYSYDQLSPADVDIDGAVQEVSVGRYDSCVLTSSGAVRCWGAEYTGQRGDGESESVAYTNITGEVLTGTQMVVAGYGHTCAITIAGGVRCWGDGSEGQLGDGRASYRATPVWVKGTCRQ